MAFALTLAACASHPAPEAREVADANDTGTAVGARSGAERAVLSLLPTLPSGQSRQVSGAVVVAEPAYAAASGRTCRGLTMSAVKGGTATHRLACSSGGTWFFVPDVFGAEPAQN